MTTCDDFVHIVENLDAIVSVEKIESTFDRRQCRTRVFFHIQDESVLLMGEPHRLKAAAGHWFEIVRFAVGGYDQMAVIHANCQGALLAFRKLCFAEQVRKQSGRMPAK